MYAARKGWELGELRVDVDYDNEADPRRFDVDAAPARRAHGRIRSRGFSASPTAARSAARSRRGFAFEERTVVAEPALT